MSTLTGKTVLVVGGAQGIGRATAELCAERGARVVIADLNAEQGAQVAAATRGTFYSVNVADEESVRALFERITSDHGKLDALLQTAGVLRGPYIPIEEFDLSMFRNVMDINVIGSFLCAKYAVPLLRASGRGVIVLVSSLASVMGSSSYAYGTSKGGVDALGVTLAAKHEADNIRVNVVRPGNISTAMKLSVIEEDARRRGQDYDKMVAGFGLGEPRGVAQVLAWLASDDADYVRGALHTR
jgi:NAD(P)-dependent dehydrogenase (short-subunit alcohol dehydrogenase family)